MFQHLKDWIASNENALVVNAFVEQIHSAARRVRQQPRADMVNDFTIALLRHFTIETPIPCFHMKNRHIHLLGHDRRQSAIGIPEDQAGIGPYFINECLGRF